MNPIRSAVAAALLALIAAPAAATADEAPPPCHTKEFKTELVKEACEKGGQPAAKDAMKKFSKEAKLKNCKQCHSSLGPDFELKPDGVEQFKKAGGKLLAHPEPGPAHGKVQEEMKTPPAVKPAPAPAPAK